MFFACLAVVGQVNQVWWSKGRVLHVNPVAGIDSVTFGQFVNADTFLIVIDRASRRIVYDTIDEHVPGMVFHDTIHTTHTVYLNPGRRIGVFSVAKDRQVSFSQGNLQYVRNQDVWKFADQQYEYIGAGNVKDGKLANKIDLFGWSADNTTAPFGVSTSTNNADYAGDFVDWGVNEINGEAPNTWRTLSKDEWEYLFEKRKNAQKLYGVAQVNGSNGIIILPDNWSFDNGISFKTGLHSVETDDYSIFQSFTDQEFSVLESFGAVFLHASGWREGISIEKSQRSGYYWSSIPYNNTDAYRMTFYSYYLKPCDIHYKYRGRSVRLVYDTIVPPPPPCKTFDVNGVKFNMMCVEGGEFMMGDDSSNNTSPAHQVTLSDYYIGQTEVTQALWKAVMGTNPSSQNDDPYKPVGNVSWDDAQLFVEKLSKKTGLNFRLPTEAEWEYAAMGGKLSRGYKYSGSDSINMVAWYGVNSDNKSHVVGTKMPNELGIYDMSGNVWEWVSDWYGNYSTQKQINPQGPSSGTVRVLRSGSYVTQAASRCAIKYRQSRKADYPDVHIGFRIVLDTMVRNCYTFTQEHWDAATSLWGHGGRGHAPSDQSCIQGTIVHGVRLKVAKIGSLNVYKVPSLTEKTEDNFELVATLTTDSTGVQDFDFPQPVYVGPNEYLVFGKPSEEMPTLSPCYIAKPTITFPIGSQGFAHFIGDKKAKNANTQSVLMVEFY